MRDLVNLCSCEPNQSYGVLPIVQFDPNSVGGLPVDHVRNYGRDPYAYDIPADNIDLSDLDWYGPAIKYELE